MVNNIINKVVNLPRLLEKTNRNNPSGEKIVNVISTFGRDDILCKITDSISKVLINNKMVSKFTYTKRTAASLKNKLNNSKYVSLKEKYGSSIRCNRPRCKNCNRMSNLDYIKDANGKKHSTTSGKCTSRNIIYAATCQLCLENYTGKSTQMSSCRNNGHRGKFIKYANDMGRGGNHQKYIVDDEYSLGIHLYNEHGIVDTEGFDSSYRFTILESCSPRNLDVKEHIWVQKLKSIYPHGLNLVSPFGLPLLD